MFKEPIRVVGSSLSGCMAEVTMEMSVNETEMTVNETCAVG